MAQLLFFDENHTYELDGVKLPSVSEIIRFISREEYGDINQFTLDIASNRGTSVHKACEQLFKFGEAEITEDIAGYVKAFIDWKKKCGIDILQMEKALACEDYAGTVDIIGVIEDEHVIVDLKTVSTVKKTLVKAQLNGYKRLVEEKYGSNIKHLLCVQLMSNGKYREYPVALDDTEFNACLMLHKAMAKKHSRGIIE